jgi:hypothetical protein
VFLSYTEDDRETIATWVDSLSTNDFGVWWDRDGLRAGDAYAHKIREAIDSSDVLLALWSQSSCSTQKPWVLAEVTHAFENGVPVVFMQKGRCDIPLPFNIRHRHMLGEFEADVERIVRDLRENAKGTRSQKRTAPTIWSPDHDQVFDPSTVSIAVIGAEIPGLEPRHSLHTHTRQAIDRHGDAIWKKVNELVNYDRVPNPQEPPLAALRDVKSLKLLPELDILSAFQSWEALIRTVQIVSNADIALFDLTDFQPGVLMLLGIRAVARKGITISSVGGNGVAGYNTAVPFNLQMLNLAFHPTSATTESRRPRDVIASKIISGFNDLSRLPFYRDLPAFDAVRQLGVEASDFASITYDRRVLALSPFSSDYLSGNWQELNGELSAALTRHFETLPPTERESYRQQNEGKTPQPVITQLLEEDSSRLVLQTLYEAIRRTQMCIVDFSGVRPNVFYELGVRLASNRSGLVCISATPDTLLETDPIAKRNSQLQHFRALRERFDPVSYAVDGSAPQQYPLMIARFRDSLETAGRPEAHVYDAVGQAQAATLYSVTPSVVDELRSSAALAAADPDSRYAGSSVLYHETNRKLFKAQQMAALERKLAAWLYINYRYTVDAIRQDWRLEHHYRLYANHILDADEIDSELKALVEGAITRFDENT